MYINVWNSTEKQHGYTYEERIDILRPLPFDYG